VLAAHDSYLDGHVGIQNSSFYWPSMKKIFKQVVEKCDIYKQANLDRVAYIGFYIL